MPSKPDQQRLKQIAHLELGAQLHRLPMQAQARLQVEKWVLVVAALGTIRLTDKQTMMRSAQWRRTASLVRDIGSPELLDWTLQQAEIARNIENGIRDLRPRKDGPTIRLTSDFAAARLAKARRVLAWVEAAVASGADQSPGASRVFTSEPERHAGHEEPATRTDDEPG